MGLLVAEEGKPEEGKALLTKALSLDNSYPACHYYTGYLLGKNGRLEEGLRLFDETAALDPRNVDGYLLKGRLLEEHHRTAEAASAYRTALELLLELK